LDLGRHRRGGFGTALFRFAAARDRFGHLFCNYVDANLLVATFVSSLHQFGLRQAMIADT